MEEGLKDADKEVLMKVDEAFLIEITGLETFELQKRQNTEVSNYFKTPFKYRYLMPDQYTNKVSLTKRMKVLTIF